MEVKAKSCFFHAVTGSDVLRSSLRSKQLSHLPDQLKSVAGDTDKEHLEEKSVFE